MACGADGSVEGKICSNCGADVSNVPESDSARINLRGASRSVEVSTLDSPSYAKWITVGVVLGILPFAVITLPIVSFHLGRRDQSKGWLWGLLIAIPAIAVGVTLSGLGRNLPAETIFGHFVSIAGASIVTLCVLFAYIGERSGRRKAKASESISSSEEERATKSVDESTHGPEESAEMPFQYGDKVTAQRTVEDVERLPAPFKQCPYCAEEIQSAAIKCRFCGEWLDVTQDRNKTRDDEGQ